MNTNKTDSSVIKDMFGESRIERNRMVRLGQTIRKLASIQTPFREALPEILEAGEGLEDHDLGEALRIGQELPDKTEAIAQLKDCARTGEIPRFLKYHWAYVFTHDEGDQAFKMG